MEIQISIYQVEGIKGKFNKQSLPLEVIKDYATKNNCSIEELRAKFPKKVQGEKEVISKKEWLNTSFSYHLKHPISLPDQNIIYVCKQWNIQNINNFIYTAKNLGYNISETKEKYPVNEINFNTLNTISFTKLIQENESKALELHSIQEQLIQFLNNSPENKSKFWWLLLFAHNTKDIENVDFDLSFKKLEFDFVHDYAFDFIYQEKNILNGLQFDLINWIDGISQKEGNFITLVQERYPSYFEEEKQLQIELITSALIVSLTELMVNTWPNEKDLSYFFWTLLENPIPTENIPNEEQVRNCTLAVNEICHSFLGKKLEHFDAKKNPKMDYFKDLPYDCSEIAKEVLATEIFSEILS